MSGGAAGGGGFHWAGAGRSRIGAYIAQERAKEQTYKAVEADMEERGLPIPPRPMSQIKVFWIGFTCGLLLGLFIGLVFWELT